VDTEDLARDDGCDGEGIEDVNERLPGLDVCTPFTFIVESVDYQLAVFKVVTYPL
jgi:hypothetical protein